MRGRRAARRGRASRRDRLCMIGGRSRWARWGGRRGSSSGISSARSTWSRPTYLRDQPMSGRRWSTFSTTAIGTRRWRRTFWPRWAGAWRALPPRRCWACRSACGWGSAAWPMRLSTSSSSFCDHPDGHHGRGASGQRPAHPGGALARRHPASGAFLRRVPGVFVDDLHWLAHRARRSVFLGRRRRVDGGQRRARLDGVFGEPVLAHRYHPARHHPARPVWHGAEPHAGRDRQAADPLAGARVMRPWIATALTASALAAGWMYLTLSGAVSDLFLPPPRELWDALLDLLQNGDQSRPLWEHIADSLIRVFAGFGLGAAVGTLLGLLMGYLT